MKANKTLAYGLACLYYLGENNDGQWNLVKKISEFQGLSACYCAKVLRALVNAGFVESRKGRGYRLRKDLDDIPAWAFMESFISAYNGAPAIKGNQMSLKLHRVLYEAVNHWLVGLSVQDIIEMTEIEKPQERKVLKIKHPYLSPILSAAK